MTSTLLLVFSTFASAFFLLIAKWVYQQRRIIRFWLKSKGPPVWELALKCGFDTNANNIYKIMSSVTEKYSELDCGWLGAHLSVIIKTPETFKLVYNSQKTLSKGFYMSFLKPAYGEGLFTAEPSIWKRHRKLINPTFSSLILDGFVEVFREEAAALADTLQVYDGKGVFDLLQHFNDSTLNVIFETAIGVKNVQERASLEEIADQIVKINEIVMIRITNVRYHSDWIFSRTKLGRDQAAVIEDYQKLATSIVKKKRIEFTANKSSNFIQTDYEEVKKPRKAFLDHLIEISESDSRDSDNATNTKLTDREITEEVATFIFGGSETSAVTLCFFFCMMGMHPEIQERVFQETVDVLGPDRIAEATDLSNLKYTERVIKESMRLFPIAAFTLRAVTEDLVVNDKVTLPEGIELLLCNFSVHRNAEYFPNPLVFDPDRFLPEEVEKRHPYAYTPFSGGHRICVGQNYAMKFMKIVISTLIRRFLFFTDYKKIEDIELKWCVLLKAKHGYKVSLVSRK